MLASTDGQKIAKRLTLQISKENASIQSLMDEYNACHCPGECCMLLSDILNPSILETRLQELGMWSSIASGKKREIIDAYLDYCRSKEEIFMIQDDAKNVVTYYYQNKKKVLLEEIQRQSLNSQSTYGRGATALLFNKLAETSRLLHQSIETEEIVNRKVHSPLQYNDDIMSSCSDYSSEDEF